MNKKTQRMVARINGSQDLAPTPPNPWRYSGAQFPPFGFPVLSCVRGEQVELYTFLPTHVTDWAERPRYWLPIPPLPAAGRGGTP